MPTKTHIYGLDCQIPDAPPLSKIDGSKLPTKKQKFKRTELPSSFEDVEFDSEGNAIYSDDQLKFIDREIDRCLDGYWFMNKGEATWIPGFYYYYLTYWTLENGIKPEYRASSRKFFIFFEECYNDPYILFLIRGKKRREGATSEGTCIEVRIATFEENKRCGNVSKTGTDVIDMFQNMIVYGFSALPVFMKPRTDGSTNSKRKLSFVEAAKRGKGAKVEKVSGKREGLNSFIDYRNTGLNAYDSGRQTFVLVDESGKWEEVDVSKYILILQQVLKEGAAKRGFSYWPTTINPPKKGGNNFKKVWDKADQFKYGRQTPQRAVRFFQDAAEGLAGFIDEYGESVVDPPDEETLAFLVKRQEENPPRERIPTSDLAKGAAKYLDDQLELLTEEEDRSEFKRMYPRREDDMFDFGDIESPFNKEKIKQQIKFLEQNPVPLRRGNLLPEYGTKNIMFSDDPKGKWLIYKPPSNPNDFTEFKVGSTEFARPNNDHKYTIGVDTFRVDKTNELGSNGVICVGTKFDSSDDESGEIVALYVGRPKLTELFWREILMACMWYGGKAVVEKDATQEYKKYFNNTMTNMLDMNCNNFLFRTPDAAIDENRKTKNNNKFDFGVSSADPFAFAKEIELAQAYFEKYCWKIKFLKLLEQGLVFDVGNRTAFDEMIAFMMWLLGITGETKAKKAQAQKAPLVKQYTLANY
jgi:hypothetical protein